MELSDLKCLRGLIANDKRLAALPICPKEYLDLEQSVQDKKQRLCIEHMQNLKNKFLDSLDSYIASGITADPLQLLDVQARSCVHNALTHSVGSYDLGYNKNGVLNQEQCLKILVQTFINELPVAKRFIDLLRSAQTLELFATTLNTVKESTLNKVKESLDEALPIFLPAVPQGQYQLEHLTVYGHASIIDCLRKRLEDYDTIFSRSTNEVQTYWRNIKKLVEQSSGLNELLLDQYEDIIA